MYIIINMPKTTIALQRFKEDGDAFTEIGIDEAGRGPMFGRVYAAAVVLPRDGDFKHEDMKDSKRFHSEKKITAVADYIKDNALAYGVAYATSEEIDRLNIRNATHTAMHAAIRTAMAALEGKTFHLLVDGNDFKPLMIMDGSMLTPVRYTCIEGGDNRFTSIAAASILAKVERDKYIAEVCAADPTLDERYGLLKNKGYGTQQHMDGIREHGVAAEHRRSFGICRQFA